MKIKMVEDKKSINKKLLFIILILLLLLSAVIVGGIFVIKGIKNSQYNEYVDVTFKFVSESETSLSEIVILNENDEILGSTPDYGIIKIPNLMVGSTIYFKSEEYKFDEFDNYKVTKSISKVEVKVSKKVINTELRISVKFLDTNSFPIPNVKVTINKMIYTSNTDGIINLKTSSKNLSFLPKHRFFDFSEVQLLDIVDKQSVSINGIFNLEKYQEPYYDEEGNPHEYSFSAGYNVYNKNNNIVKNLTIVYKNVSDERIYTKVVSDGNILFVDKPYEYFYVYYFENGKYYISKLITTSPISGYLSAEDAVHLEIIDYAKYENVYVQLNDSEVFVYSSNGNGKIDIVIPKFTSIKIYKKNIPYLLNQMLIYDENGNEVLKFEMSMLNLRLK